MDKLKIIDLKKILRDNGLSVSGTKSVLINRLESSNIKKQYIYENDIKITPVYIQKEMNISKQTVVELKKLLKHHGLKVSGTKPILIQRLLDAGLVDPSSPMEKPKLTSPYAKMKVVEMKSLLRKYGLKVSGKKEELIARLENSDARTRKIELENKAVEEAKQKKQEAMERDMMEYEDMPESMAIADVFLPMQPNSQIALPHENNQLMVLPYYHGQYLSNKYSPVEVAQQIERDRLLEEFGYPSEQVTMGMLTNILPIDVVRQTLSTTHDNRVIFQSQYSTELYDTDELDDEVRATRRYNVDGWMFQIVEINDNWAIVYKRILNADRLLQKVTDSVKQKVEDFLQSLPKDIKQVIIEYPQLRYCTVSIGIKQWVVNYGNGNYKYNGTFYSQLGPNRDLCGLLFHMYVKPHSRLPEPTRTVIYTVTEDGDFVELG